MVELNPRVWAILFVIFIGFSLLIAPTLFMKPKPVVNTTPNITYIYKTIIKTVTPTPDGHIYFAGEYQNGTRLLQRPYSFIRYNVLGKQDMKVTTIVYNYMIFDTLHWFNPSLYKYQEQYPQTPDSKFLLVFVTVFMDNVVGDDTRMWAFNRDFFAVYDGKNTYRQLNYPYQLRFRELENTNTFDDSTKVQAFKSLRLYSPSSDYHTTAGEYNSEIYYLRAGASNAIDGFLIYEIPKNDNPEDILVLGQFYNFGSAQWRLKL